MTRRALLAMLASASGDPERLLWKPGRKLISVPAETSAVETIYPLGARRVPFGYLHGVSSGIVSGETFWIPGVYDVNPITGRRAIYTDRVTGRRFQFPKRFVAQEARIVPAGGTVTHDSPRVFDMWPPMMLAGQYRNCDRDLREYYGLQKGDQCSPVAVS